MSGDHVSAALTRGRLVKICGLRQPAHAVAAARAGADLLGFIFAPARRQVTPEEARACISAAREAASERDLIAIGVFVDAPCADIREAAAAAGLDGVQLHGAESISFIAELGLPVIQALRPKRGAAATDVVSVIDSSRYAPSPPAGFLLDGFSAQHAGGAGVRADWTLARDVVEHLPVMLAGGLDPGNVAEAIHQVRPRGVDVSSGIEIDGVKDEVLIAAFVGAAKEAFASLTK